MRISNLFLERSRGEKIVIGEGQNQIEIEVTRIRGNNVTLVCRAAPHIKIDRMERRITPTK